MSKEHEKVEEEKAKKGIRKSVYSLLNLNINSNSACCIIDKQTMTDNNDA